MKLLSLAATIMIFASHSFADAGYLRSIVQNPVPASSLSTSIEMTSEDVLIEIYPGGYAGITASFLFTNFGVADTVIMYFPVTVHTLTMGPGLGLYDITDPLDSPVITVNGIQTEVHPMIGNTWLPQYNEYTWQDVRSEVFTMNEAEPDTGEFYCYIVDPDSWDDYDFMKLVYGDSGELSLLEELLTFVNSLNASWTVPFGCGEEVLVEVSMEYNMSSGYEDPYFTMIYPLFTGASWAGSIGTGRITAVAAGELSFTDFDSWYSVAMPDPVIAEDLIYEPLRSISCADGFENTVLAAYSGEYYESALVWEFTDFEPVVSPSEWQYFYYSPENPDGRFHSGAAGVDTVGWSSSLRIDVRDPLWKME